MAMLWALAAFTPATIRDSPPSSSRRRVFIQGDERYSRRRTVR